MNIKFFELQDGKVVPSEICYTSKTLKEIMKVFKKDKNYIKVYTFLFHLYCPDPLRNPFLNIPEREKEEILMKELEIDFSLDEVAFEEAKKFTENLFTTPARRFYLDCKIGLEKQGEYLRKTTIEYGRDGNDTTYLATLKAVGVISDQFAKVEKAYESELRATVRGGAEKSFDE